MSPPLEGPEAFFSENGDTIRPGAPKDNPETPKTEAKGNARKPELAPLRVLTGEELINTEFPPRENILAPWLPMKGTAMIYGPRGIGKTYLTIGIALAVATGGAFLQWKAPQPRRVLVIDGEMPATALQERLIGACNLSNLEPPDSSYLRFMAADLQERGIDISNTDHQAEIEGLIGDAELIIIDNISTLASCGKENEAESWLPIQQWALLQRRSGRTVLFMHHAGKGGQQRGTSRREDVLDTTIALRQPADYEQNQGARFEVHYEKARGFHGNDANPFEASLGAGGWTMRSLEDADIKQVMSLHSRDLTVREIARELDMSKSRVDRLLQKGKAMGCGAPPDEEQ